MGIYEQADILGAGMALVPNWADQELQRKTAAMNLQGMGINQDNARLQGQMMQRQMSEYDKKAAREEQYQFALKDALANPDATRISNLILAHPEYATEIKQSWELRDGAARQADLTQMGSIYAAASAGNYALAAKTARARMEADKAAGQDVSDDMAIIEALESPDENLRKKALLMVGSNLAAIVGPDHFATVFGTISEGTSDFTLSPGGRRYDATGKLIAEAPFAPRPITVGEGQTVVEYAPGGSVARPSVGGGGVPRGIRNNNPGNLEYGPFAKKMGASGSDGRFAIFPSMEAGNRAQEALLAGKGYHGGGRKTINAIIGKYAPSTDNNNVGNYAGYVARRMGISPDTELTAAQIPQVAAAMREFENGQQQGGGKATRPKGMSNEQLKAEAAAAIAKGADPAAVNARLKKMGVK